MSQISEDEANIFEKRANKNRLLAGILTFFFAPFGYLYTIRYPAALISFLVLMPLYAFANEDPDNGEPLLGFFAIGVTIENIISINNAKEKSKVGGNKSSNFNSNPTQEQTKTLDITILKALKNGPMTVSEIVIATELSPSLVKETLKQLESEQLIYGYNRDSDGAVVYKNI